MAVFVLHVTKVRTYLNQITSLGAYTEFGFSEENALNHLRENNYDTQKALESFRPLINEFDGQRSIYALPEEECFVCGLQGGTSRCHRPGCERGTFNECGFSKQTFGIRLMHCLVFGLC